ncbi:MAG: hypothetical protein R3C44_06930 [Chloroflexota bacterium]
MYRLPRIDETTRWRLAPWCYAWDGGIYHDYLAQHLLIPSLQALVTDLPDGFTSDMAGEAGVAAAELDNWQRRGPIVPILPQS